MIIVLDTNVLVSGLLTPFGPSGEVVRMVSDGILVLQFDSRILLEYKDVLHRPKFKFDKNQVDIVLDFITQNGQIVAARPLKRRLPDVDDEPFLEVAIAGNDSCLVSGNKVHFPRQAREGMKVFSPAEFLEFYREHDRDTPERS